MLMIKYGPFGVAEFVVLFGVFVILRLRWPRLPMYVDALTFFGWRLEDLHGGNVREVDIQLSYPFSCVLEIEYTPCERLIILKQDLKC
jgi:hypothetical protein